MDKIFKYPLPARDPVELWLPQGADILCVKVQHGLPYIWARINEHNEPTKRILRVFKTGKEMDTSAALLMYIGTFLVDDDKLVFHVFEEMRAEDFDDVIDVTVMTEPERASLS